MTVGRIYRMIAGAGKEQELADELVRLRPLVRALPGSQGVEVYRDRDDRSRFLLVEKWESVAYHEQALASLPPEALGALMQKLAGPPEAAYEDLL